MPRGVYERVSVRERFDARWTPEPNTGCWLWTGGLMNRGYGKLCFGDGTRLAHRVSWELHRGPIPEGLVLDHVCRVRSCVNPDHLRLVTIAQNVLENSVSESALHAKQTHCLKGHELPPKIVGVRYRKCMLCHPRRMEAQREARRLKKEQSSESLICE